MSRRRPTYGPTTLGNVVALSIAAATVALGWSLGASGARAVLRRVVR